MTHAPVYFTIVQVRFNPVLSLDSYAPAIQDQFRRHGFPDFQAGVVQSFNLNVVNPAEPVPVSKFANYRFSNMEKTWAFLLDQGSLSLQTTSYDVFESFSMSFLKGLEIVHRAVGNLTYTDRIGVRFLDAIYPKPGEDLSYYLHSSVLGLYGKLKGDLGHSFSETLVRDGPLGVIARSIVQDGAVGFPPDLQPAALTIDSRFTNLTGIHAILDTDGFLEHRVAFSLDQVETTLKAAHSAVTKAFKAAVTDGALEAWK
jgi:uncharacterized protein (TIGR04255 family)